MSIHVFSDSMLASVPLQLFKGSSWRLTMDGRLSLDFSLFAIPPANACACMEQQKSYRPLHLTHQIFHRGVNRSVYGCMFINLSSIVPNISRHAFQASQSRREYSHIRQKDYRI